MKEYFENDSVKETIAILGTQSDKLKPVFKELLENSDIITKLMKNMILKKSLIRNLCGKKIN